MQPECSGRIPDEEVDRVIGEVPSSHRGVQERDEGRVDVLIELQTDGRVWWSTPAPGYEGRRGSLARDKVKVAQFDPRPTCPRESRYVVGVLMSETPPGGG